MSEPFDENNIEHQYPVLAISDWQYWNDLGLADRVVERLEEILE